MELTDTTLLNFSHSIPDRCRNERDTILKTGLGKWDTYVRKNFAVALEKWFLHDFGTKPEYKKYVYIEGHNTIPINHRGHSFFGTTMHPDAAIIDGERRLVAIELDHGTKGSQIRNALAKAGFSVKLGGFEQAIVLFFIDSIKLSHKLERQKNEENILRLYQEQFNTTLYIL